MVFCNLILAVATAGSSCSHAEFRPGGVEVVVAKGAVPSLGFAASEMTNFLARALGAPVPVVSAPTDGRTSVVLGSNDWSRAVGIDTGTLARDAFVLLVKGPRVYIAGRDEYSRAALAQSVEHGTLFGVYEFLHRVVGVRLYFPGELGEIVPRKEVIRVPEGRRLVAPDYSVRRYGYADGLVPEELLKTSGQKRESDFKRLNKLRLRMETMTIPCCHGQLYSRFYRRFHETHPEYFVMGKDGKRHPTEAKEKPLFNKEHVCNCSGIWNEIYEDAKAYLTGQPPEVRKIPNASGKGYSRGPGAEGKYYDIMPHDGFGACYCPSCQSRYDKTKKQFATDLLWSNTVAVARRLKAEGVPGYVTQMAYHPYADVPDFDIPDNVLVMVAQQGPWAPPKGGARDAPVRAWTKKLGRKVWLWTYPDKIYGRACPGVPQMSPKAWGEYYGGLRDEIFGAFAESESDRWLFNYLNYYVFSRVCWNSDVNVDAVLDEHHRLMFGAGAAPMKQFFESLERKWVGEVMGNTRMGPTGPETVLPGASEFWQRIYSPKVIAGYGKLLDKAEASVPRGSLEARRIAMFRRELFGPLAERAEKEHRRLSPDYAVARRKSLTDGKTVFEAKAGEPLKVWSRWPSDAKLEVSGAPGPASASPLTLVSSTNFITKIWRQVPLKPSRRYRLSCFVRLDGVVARTGFGVSWGVKAGKTKLGMENADGTEPAPMDGTTDWVLYEAYFTTPAELATDKADVLCNFHRAHGKMSFDGLRIDELTEKIK